MPSPLLIGTTNPAKLARYRTIVGHYFDGTVLSPRDIPQAIVVAEDGTTAAANARLKARAYADAAQLPTLGIDEALAVQGLPADQQPGVRVRRYGGRAASDEELLEIFRARVRCLPLDARAATWTYAYCLAIPSGAEYAKQVQIGCVFTDTVRLPILPGYPLSSLLLDPLTGKALRDLTAAEERTRLAPVYGAVAALLRDGGLV